MIDSLGLGKFFDFKIQLLITEIAKRLESPNPKLFSSRATLANILNTLANILESSFFRRSQNVPALYRHCLRGECLFPYQKILS